MRIDESDTIAALDVQATSMPQHQLALAGAGLADEVKPLAAIGASDAEDAARGAAEAVVLADDGEIVVIHTPKADHPAPCRKGPAPPGARHGNRADGQQSSRTCFSLARQTAVWVCAASVWSAVEVRRSGRDDSLLGKRTECYGLRIPAVALMSTPRSWSSQRG